MLKKTKRSYLYFVFLFFFLFFLITSNQVLAATVNFSPSSSTYHVGDTIRIKVVVSSDSSINAVSNNISFSNDLLSLTSLSKSSSIVSLWAQEPSFSNTTGTVSLEGVILNGYNGSSGHIITLIFKAKSVGIATLKFSDVSILANDGNGTDLFSGALSTGTINIEKAIKIEKPEKETKPIDTIENVIEKIEEVEISNELPDNSLLISIIILLVIILCFIVISVFLLIFKLKKYLKNRLLKIKKIIDKNFKNLEKEIKLEIKDSKQKEVNKMVQDNKKDDIMKEVIDTEDKIIEEIEKIEEEL